MHLQVRSTLTSGGKSGPGAMSVDESGGGVIETRPGLLVRLLDLLAEDRSDDPNDRHGPFNLVAAAGSGIELGGQFVFAVESDHESDEAEHHAAARRLEPEFKSDVVARESGRAEHHAGGLRDYIMTLSEKGQLIDELVLGVAECPACDDGPQGDIVVPVQVRAVRASGMS